MLTRASLLALSLLLLLSSTLASPGSGYGSGSGSGSGEGDGAGAASATSDNILVVTRTVTASDTAPSSSDSGSSFGSSFGSSSGFGSNSTSSLSSSSDTTHDIDVGNGGLSFSPDTLTASTGDTVNFHFYPKNHSIVQSSFDSPCQPLSNGTSPALFSGFMPVSGDQGKGDMMFSMTVNSTTPIWLYCSQGKHCQSGMAMVINPPSSSDKTLDAYLAKAQAVQSAGSPDTGVSGGVVVANEESGGDSGESGDSSSSSSSETTSKTGSIPASSTATAASIPPSSASASTSAPASVTGTGAAPGVVRPFATAVTVGMLAVGLGVWTLL